MINAVTNISQVCCSEICIDSAHSTIVTVAIFGPAQSRQLLAASGDPIFDLCKNQKQGVEIMSTMSTTSIASSQMSGAQSPHTTFHPDGNIIVTADYTGQIKVFRQDCAWAQRKPDTSDSASIRLRGRSTIPRGSSTSLRPSGLMTLKPTSSQTGSTRSSSRRNSIDNPSLSSQAGLSVSKNLDAPRSTPLHVNGRGVSPSPTRGKDQSTPQSRTPSNQGGNYLQPSGSATRTGDRLMLQEDGQSMAFYNLEVQRQHSVYSDQSTTASPVRNRRGSASTYSDVDMSGDEARVFVDAEERLSSDDMVCKNCGARTFNAFKVQQGPQKGETKLRCSVYVTVSSPG